LDCYKSHKNNTKHLMIYYTDRTYFANYLSDTLALFDSPAENSGTHMKEFE